jgi:hypothetical protein
MNLHDWQHEVYPAMADCAYGYADLPKPRTVEQAAAWAVFELWEELGGTAASVDGYLSADCSRAVLRALRAYLDPEVMAPVLQGLQATSRARRTQQDRWR